LERGEDIFGFELIGNHVNVNVQIGQSFSRCLTDRADFQFVQITGFVSAPVEPGKKIKNRISAGKDDPIVAVEMFDGLVEEFITV